MLEVGGGVRSNMGRYQKIAIFDDRRHMKVDESGISKKVDYAMNKQ